MSKMIAIQKAFDDGLLKVGQRVECTANGLTETTELYTGKIVSIDGTRLSIKRDDGKGGNGVGKTYYADINNTVGKISIIKSKLEVDKLIKEGISDVRGFIKENRAVIYWVSLILLADHFIFKGKFKHKLKSTFNALIDRVNASITKDTKG